MTSRKNQVWVIAPEADGEFVARKEGVLDVDEKPYDASHPVLAMDEQRGTKMPLGPPSILRHCNR